MPVCSACATFLAPGGRWIVIDYFRVTPSAKNRSGHLLLADFEAALVRHGWRIDERLDITDNVVPSLGYARVLAERFALPVAQFFSEKMFLRHPLAGYLVAPNVREKLAAIRLDTLDPEVFRREKRYLLFTLSDPPRPDRRDGARATRRTSVEFRWRTRRELREQFVVQREFAPPVVRVDSGRRARSRRARNRDRASRDLRSGARCRTRAPRRPPCLRCARRSI
jgi:hypothetical protein